VADYLSVKEYAAKLRVTEKTVYRWIRSGALRAVKHGNTIRIPLRLSAVTTAPRT
jgi:excisionase family DNA binding protein